MLYKKIFTIVAVGDIVVVGDIACEGVRADRSAVASSFEASYLGRLVQDDCAFDLALVNFIAETVDMDCHGLLVRLGCLSILGY